LTSPETTPVAEPAAAPETPPAPRGWDRVEAWVSGHFWLPVLLVFAGALVARVLVALPAALNPDEAMHVTGTMAQPNLYLLWKGDLVGPDPSLIHFIIFPLVKAFASDFVLRLPFIITGSLAALFVYKWLAELFDRTTGLAAMVLVAFAPAAIFVSAEVRAYALVLFFSAVALYCLEAGARRQSVVLLTGFGAAQCLALVSQYSAAIVLFVAGVYSLVLLAQGRMRGRPLRVWLGAELLTVALLVFQYVTHLSKLLGSSAKTYAQTGFLSGEFFNPGRDKLLGFVATRSLAAFRFLFTSRGIGIAALVLFLAGVLLLAVRGFPREGRRTGRAAAWLVFGPWLVAVAAGLLALYPFGGTRHIMILLLFAAAGVAVLVRRVAGNRPALVLAAAALLVPAWNLARFHAAAGWSINLKDTRRTYVQQMAADIRQALPDGGTLFADLESYYVCRRYLFRGYAGLWRPLVNGFYELDWDRFRLVTLDYWELGAGALGDEFHRFAEAYGLEPGTKVAVVSSGWGPSLAQYLEWSHKSYPDTRTFGRQNSVIMLPVGGEQMSDSLAGRVARVRRVLDSLWSAVTWQGAHRAPVVVWPSYYLDDSNRVRLSRGAERVTTLARFADSVVKGRATPERYLPALVFRVFGSPERSLDFMRYMDERENYRSAGYRFTLLATDPDTLVGVYLVESSSRGGINTLLESCRGPGARRCATAVLPAGYRQIADQAELGRVAARSLTYSGLALLLEDYPLDRYLPALAFWEVGTREEFPEFMGFMNGLESYYSAGYRFTLLDVAPDSSAGLYLVEPFVNPRLAALAGALAAKLEDKPAAIVVPARQKPEVERALANGFAGRLLSYDELYRLLAQDGHKLDEFLPALAMWEFGSKGQHPEFMGYMDERENYVSAGYAFTLVGMDPEGTVGAYLIEPGQVPEQ